MGINCLRVVPKIPPSAKHKIIISHSFSHSLLFTKRSSRATHAAAASSSMSYEKELAAAKKAASLAALLCQAILSLSPSLFA